MLQREPQRPPTAFWPKPDASLVAYVQSDRRKTIEAYRIKPEYIREHFDIVQAVLSSGYRYRQVFEVVQNAADAILEAANDAILEAANSVGSGGRILVRVTNSHLYVANTGAPLSKDGIIALLGAHSSRKGKTQIGRFGLGFKSLLALEGKIDLFSRSVSIRFDPVACQGAISEELSLAAGDMAPSLRMADVIFFDEEASGDEQLLKLGPWATTILRAEIKADGLEAHLIEELKEFPREFVLFLPVDVSVELDLGDGTSRAIHRESDGDAVVLHEDDDEERWLIAETTVPSLTPCARTPAFCTSEKKSKEYRSSGPSRWTLPRTPEPFGRSSQRTHSAAWPGS